jgi:hypothetical protein
MHPLSKVKRRPPCNKKQACKRWQKLTSWILSSGVQQVTSAVFRLTLIGNKKVLITYRLALHHSGPCYYTSLNKDSKKETP